LKAACPYGQIFEPSPPPGTDRLRLNQDIPRPFVIRPPFCATSTAGDGIPLTFELILIGSALDYLPYFLITFRELGQQGIGIARGRYTIRRVLALHNLLTPVAGASTSYRPSLLAGEAQSEGVEIYSASEQLVRPSPHRLTFDDCHRLASEWTAGSEQRVANSTTQLPCPSQLFTDNRQRLTVRFLTPTHLKANGTVVTRPDFHHLIKRLRDRINALAHFYCGDALEVDFKAFGERAESIRAVSCRIRWEDRDRRSWRTGQSHDMGGFVGEVTYEGDLQEFLPLLILGQYTHVGKYAVWGNGQYEVRVI
jgi:hypothetical protein